MIKRKKIGNTTVTINTRTGRQTTSRRVGNITYSQSNQGHNRSTQTFNFGNGWFERKTTNHNKKSRRSKSIGWAWLFGKKKSAKPTNMPEVKIAASDSLPDNNKDAPNPYSWKFWVFWIIVATIYETYKRGYWGF